MEVGACRQLQSLNASNNSLASLPTALLSCQLTTLHASNNKMACHFLAEDFSSLAVRPPRRHTPPHISSRRLAPAHAASHHLTPYYATA